MIVAVFVVVVVVSNAIRCVSVYFVRFFLSLFFSCSVVSQPLHSCMIESDWIGSELKWCNMSICYVFRLYTHTHFTIEIELKHRSHHNYTVRLREKKSNTQTLYDDSQSRTFFSPLFLLLLLLLHFIVPRIRLHYRLFSSFFSSLSFHSFSSLFDTK